MLPFLFLATLPVMPEPPPPEMRLRVGSQGVVFQGKTLSSDLDVSAEELAVLHSELSALRAAAKSGGQGRVMGTLVLEISAEVQLGQISGVLSEFWAARVMQVQVAVAGHQGPTLLPLSFGGAHPVDSVVAGRGGFATLALDGEACQLAYALVSAPTHYEKSLYYPDCKGFEGMLDVDLLDPVVSIAASDTTSWQEIVAAQRRILGASRLPALVLGLAPDWRRATEPGGWIHKGERPVYYAVQADGVVRANGYPIDGQWHERSFLCEGPKVLSFKPLAEAYELVLHPAGGVMAGREQRCDDGRSGVTAYK